MNSLRQVFTATVFAMPSVLLAATPTQQELQKLLASDGAAEDSFGFSVAVSSDTAVIGALNDDDNGYRSGSAYVYTRNASGVWIEQAKLQASDGAAEDSFGRSVSVSGDTAVIGAAGDDDNSHGSGSAYVYTRDASGVWSEQTKLLARDSRGFEGFGWSVAVSGDTAVIGAPHALDAPYETINSGSAYVYARNANGAWSEQAKLLASDGAAVDRFGGSVAISGDTVIIGAYGDDDNGDASGSAYVFTRNAGGAWSEQTKLLASDGAAVDYFGRSVAVSGDTAVIGAPGYDFYAPDANGSAYVYTRNASGAWSEQTKLLASDGERYDEFGSSVAISGDMSVIAARSDDDNGFGSGAAYLYTRDAGGVWSEQAKLLATDGAATDDFGSSVAVSGATAVIGASSAHGDGFGTGSAYVYILDPRPVSATLQCPGDINGDGVAELVLVTEAGQVRVKDVTGAGINSFELAGPARAVDTELMPDTNSNGAPELVVLGRSPATAEVRDLLTGGDLGTVTFDADLAPVNLELTTDRTGNGIPELAALAEDPMRLDVRDGLTGTAVADFGFARHLTGRDLTSYPDQNGDGAPELAVLADNRRQDRADKIEIRDVSTGAIVREIWLGWDWRVLEQELIADLNGNGSAEVAVLRVHPDGDVNVQIRDTVTREWVSFVGFPVKYPPKALVAIPDINGNGADELVVFGRRFDGNDQKAVIKDSRTGDKLGELWFDRHFPGQDFVDCGDLNGNGATDLALYGQRPSDGRLQVIVKDSKTGERLALVWFD